MSTFKLPMFPMLSFFHPLSYNFLCNIFFKSKFKQRRSTVFCRFPPFPYNLSPISFPRPQSTSNSKMVFPFLVACTRLYTPLSPSVGRSVGRSVGQLVSWSVTPYFCPGGLETSNMAPAHQHVTSVAVYPALLL